MRVQTHGWCEESLHPTNVESWKQVLGQAADGRSRGGIHFGVVYKYSSTIPLSQHKFDRANRGFNPIAVVIQASHAYGVPFFVEFTECLSTKHGYPCLPAALMPRYLEDQFSKVILWPSRIRYRLDNDPSEKSLILEGEFEHIEWSVGTL
jgi:hypothetical protein